MDNTIAEANANAASLTDDLFSTPVQENFVEQPTVDPMEEALREVNEPEELPSITEAPIESSPEITRRDILANGPQGLGFTTPYERNYVELNPSVEARLTELENSGLEISANDKDQVQNTLGEALSKGNWVAPMLLEPDNLSTTDFTEWHGSIQAGKAMSKSILKNEEVQYPVSLAMGAGYREASLTPIMVKSFTEHGVWGFGRGATHMAAGLVEAIPLLTSTIQQTGLLDLLPEETLDLKKYKKRVDETMFSLGDDLRSMAGEIPDDVAEGLLSNIQEGDIEGAGKAFSYQMGAMSVDLAVIGLGTFLGGWTGPVVIGTSRAGLKYADITREGRVGEGAALTNAYATGTLHAALSHLIYLEKLKSAVKLTSSMFGVATGRELAKAAIVNTAKDLTFDGSLLMATEGALATLDWVTDVDPDAFKRLPENLAEAGLLSGVTSLGFGIPMRAYGFRNRIKLSDKVTNMGDMFAETLQAINTSTNKSKVLNNSINGIKDAVDSNKMSGLVFVDAPTMNELVKLDSSLADSFNTQKSALGGENNTSFYIRTEKVLPLLMRAGNKAEGYLGSFRFAPESPTYTQAKNFNKAVYEYLNWKLFDNTTPSMASRVSETIRGAFSKKKQATIHDIELETLKEAEAFVDERLSLEPAANENTNVFDTPEPVSAQTEAPQQPKIPKKKTVLDGGTLDEGSDTYAKTPEAQIDQVARDTLDVATGMKRYKRLEADELSRKELLKQMDEVTEGFAFMQEQTDAFVDQFIDHGIVSEFDFEAMHSASYASIITNDNFITMEGVLSSGITLNPDAAKLELSGTAFKRLRKNAPQLFDADNGLSIADAASQNGMPTRKFKDILESKELGRMASYENADAYAIAMADKAARVTLDTFTKYAEARSANDASAVDNLFMTGKISKALEDALNPVEEALIRKEISRLENELKDEFTRRESNLIKIKSTPKEVSEQVKQAIGDMDHKALVSGAVIKQALVAEEMAARQVAKAVREKDLISAYALSHQRLVARETAKQAVAYAKNQYKKEKALLKKVLVRGNEAKVKKTTDLDYVYAIRVALAENNIPMAKGSLEYAKEQLQMLRDLDPLKFDAVNEAVSSMMPKEIPNEITHKQYLELIEKTKEALDAGVNNKGRENIGITTEEFIIGVSKGIYEYAEKLNDGKTGGEFSRTVKTDVRSIEDSRETTSKAKVPWREALMVSHRVAHNLGLAETSNNFMRFKGGVNSILSSFKIGPDFLFSLADKLPEKSGQMVRTMLNNAIEQESAKWKASRERVEPFVADLKTFIRSNRSKLMFKGTQDFLGTPMDAADVMGMVMYLGSESNFNSLVSRNFKGKSKESVKAAIKEAIDNGTITKEHFEVAQKFWKMFEDFLPEAQKAHKNIMGRYFKPIKTKLMVEDIIPKEWGINTKGGYVPILTDKATRSDVFYSAGASRSAMIEARKQMDLDFITENPLFFATERQMKHEMNRIENGDIGGRLDLDINSYIPQFNQILNSIYTREIGLQMAQAFSSPEVSLAMKLYDSKALSDVVEPYLKAYMDNTGHAGRLGDQTLETSFKSFDKVLNRTKEGASLIQISYNLWTGLWNPTELFKVMHYTGNRTDGLLGTNYARAVAKVPSLFVASIINPRFTNKVLRESSLINEYYNNNLRNLQKELQATTSDYSMLQVMMKGKGKKYAEVTAFMDTYSRAWDHFTQMHTNVATYVAARDAHFQTYSNYAEAIRAGEEAVIRLQPGMSSSNRSNFMRDGVGGFLGMYSDWALKGLSYAGSEARRIHEKALIKKSLRDYGELAPMVTFVLAAPVMAETMLYGTLTGDLDTDELWQKITEDPAKSVAKLWAESVVGSATRVPLFGGKIKNLSIDLAEKVGDYDPILLKKDNFRTHPVEQLGKAAYNVALDVNYKVVQKLVNATEDTRRYRTPGNTTDDVLALIGAATRAPLGPAIRRPLKYLTNYVDGSEDVPELTELINVITRGTTESFSTKRTQKSKPSGKGKKGSSSLRDFRGY